MNHYFSLVNEQAVPDHSMHFYNPKGELVGRLDCNGSELKFEGNADESAQIFIETLRQVFGGFKKDQGAGE